MASAAEGHGEGQVKAAGVIDDWAEEEEDEQELKASTPQESLLSQQLLSQLDWLPNLAMRAAHAILKPPVAVELAAKLVLATALYFLSTYLFTSELVSAVAGGAGVPSVAVQVAGARALRIELTACVFAVRAGTGAEVRVTDSTLVAPFQTSGSHVSLQDTGSCLLLSCVGPSMDLGHLVTAHLEVGPSVELLSTLVLVRTTERSSVLLSEVPYGRELVVHGENALVQLDSVNVPSLQVIMISGLLDIRGSTLQRGSLDVGSAAVSIHLRRGAVTRVRFNTTAAAGAQRVGDGLCLSDAAGAPSLEAPSGSSTAFARFGGPGQPESEINLTRGGATNRTALGQVFVDYGVSLQERTQENTYDSTGDADLAMEPGFGPWAASMSEQGVQLLRGRVVGPGMEEATAGMHQRAEWLFSFHGDVHLWHPVSLFWISTLSLYAPQAARREFLLASARCTSRLRDVQAILRDTCEVKRSAASQALGAIHAAVWWGLPENLRARNQSQSELYFVEGGGAPDGHAVFTSVGSFSRVTKFTASGARGSDSIAVLTADRSPEAFMTAKVRAFLAMGALVAAIFAAVSYAILLRGYLAERERLVREKSQLLWPGLMGAEVRRRGQEADPESGRRGSAPQPGDRVRLTDDRRGLLAAFEQLAQAPEVQGAELPRWRPQMDDMLGRVFAVQAVTAGGLIELPPPEGSQEGPWLFPASAVARVEGEEAASEPAPAFARDPRVLALRMLLRGGSRGTVFEIWKVGARDRVEMRARKLVAKGTHVFAVLDSSLQWSLPHLSKVDGLPHALLTVLLHHAFVMLLCLPLFLVSWLQVRNVVDKQTECAFADMVQTRCRQVSTTLPSATLVLLVVVQVFMLFYTFVSYLARQIDYVILPAGRSPWRALSKHRGRLLEISASPLFHFVFWLLASLLHLALVPFLVSLVAYITLGACVAPERLIPVLLGIVAVVFVAKLTLEKLQELQVALEVRLHALKEGAGDAVAAEAAFQSTMRELGFAQSHIVLLTVLLSLAFAAFVAFVLLGCSLFMSASSIMPTLISSGMVLLSAAAAIRSGQAPLTSSPHGIARLSNAFAQNLSQASNLSEKTSNLLKADKPAEELATAGALRTTVASAKFKPGIAW